MIYKLSSLFLYIFFSLFINRIQAQNLVVNPSFERLDSITENGNYDLSGVRGWGDRQILRTVYLKNSFCEENPEKCYGFSGARTGNASVGIMILTMTGSTFGISHLQGKLKQPLEKGKIYLVEFYLKLADSSNIYMQKFDVSLTPTAARQYAMPNTNSKKPWIINLLSNKLKDKENWMHINFQYMALGGERFISFGYMGIINYPRKIKYDLVDQDYWKKNNIINPNLLSAKYQLDAFYFIDDVSVIETPLTEENGRFSSIYFNSNSTIISESDLNRLEKLVKLRLSNIPDFKIIIEGFADKQGEEKDNTALSENRAKAVADYLIEHGVPPDRVKIEGFGEAQATQQTSENDRRVDVFIHI